MVVDVRFATLFEFVKFGDSVVCVAVKHLFRHV